MDNTQMFLETELISTFSKDQRMLWNLIKKYQKNQNEQWKWGTDDYPAPYIVSEMKCGQLSATSNREGKSVDMNFSQNISSNEYYGQEVKKMTTKNTD